MGSGFRKFLAAFSSIIGFTQAVVAIVTQPPQIALPAILICAACFAVASLLTEGTPRTLNAVAAAVIAFYFGITAWFFPELFRQTIRDTPPAVTIVNPPAGTSTTPVNGCIEVRFRADPETNYAFAVASRETVKNGDPLYYFEGQVLYDSATGLYAVTVALGDDGTAEAGRPYEVVVVAIEPEWRDYLRGTRGGDETWWSSLTMPPGAAVVASVSVQRDKKANNCDQ